MLIHCNSDLIFKTIHSVSLKQTNTTNAFSYKWIGHHFFSARSTELMNDTNRLQMYKVQTKKGKKYCNTTRSFCVHFVHFCWIFNSYLIRTFAQNALHFFSVCFVMLDTFAITLCMSCVFISIFLSFYKFTA